MVRAGPFPNTGVSLRIGGVFVLALALAFAGCSALPVATDPGESRVTVTPAPVPETGTDAGSSTAIQRPAGMSLPPGVRADGSVNGTELVCASNRYLVNRSHTIVTSYVLNDTRPGESTQRGTTTIRVDGERVRYEFGEPGRETGNVTYFDPTGQYERRVSNGTVTTRYVANDTTPMVTTVPVFGVAFETELGPSNVTVETVEHDGETLYRVHVPEEPSPDPDRRNYTATVYVTPSGVVRSLLVVDSVYVGDTLEGDETSDHNVYRDRYTVREVGETTVSEPAWVRTLKRNLTAANRTSPEPYRYCDR